MSNHTMQGFPVLRSKGCRGLPAGAWGVPSFLPSFARRLRRRAKEKKKGFCGDTPHPSKGLPPSALLLDGRIGKPCHTMRAKNEALHVVNDLKCDHFLPLGWKSFFAGVERDAPTVKEALHLPWRKASF
ncbi:hypothetical protein [Reticulibacter mediterranei]|uniref:hypothetical protein n=1 Tax=Reticulibacter mediterranei TaxID=2778369 RepID=UPI001C6906BA|nr:hypothetical protein [Reticulibacter mediterranei]